MSLTNLYLSTITAPGSLLGTIVGYKLGSAFYSDEKEPLKDIKNKYITQVKLFELSLADKFLDKKIYAYYLYALIISQQDLLNKLTTEINLNSNIEYYKNTLPQWEQSINDIKIDLKKTLYRFLCYETLLKNIFDIPYQEKDLSLIAEKFLPFDMLSEEQVSKLITWIINPLFNGWFDLEVKNIDVLKCSKIYILESEKNICQSLLIKEFPFPDLMTKEQLGNINHKESIFDCIRPWILSNLIISKQNLSKELQDSWAGTIDSVISGITGIKKSYTIQTGKKAEELAGTAADYYNELKKEFRDLKNSLGNLYTNTSNVAFGFTEALKYGAIGLGGIILINLLAGDE